MRFFEAIWRGLMYYASIMPTKINGPEEFSLEVYTRDWRGQKMPEYQRLYKTEKAAVEALMRKYSEARWREL